MLKASLRNYDNIFLKNKKRVKNYGLCKVDKCI